MKLELVEYAEHITSDESSVLKKLNRETNLKVLNSRMLSGHLQGVLLKMFSKMIRPKNILEIGTYTGYSAICLAAGLIDEGTLYTIECNYELKEMLNSYFNEAGISEKIELYIGNALDIIPTIDQKFDLVFIDADKENYLNYYKMIIGKLNTGGFIIADNVLWDGKVIQDPEKADSETKGLIDFNNFIKEDQRVEQMLLPFRDGLLIIRKV